MVMYHLCSVLRTTGLHNAHLGSSAFGRTGESRAGEPQPSRETTRVAYRLLLYIEQHQMSHTQPIPSPTFGYIRLFDMRKALLAYQEMTGLDLLAHPLAGKLAACKSPAAIVHLLSQLNQPRNHDEMLSKWLDPTVKVLCAFSAALEEGGVSVVCLIT